MTLEELIDELEMIQYEANQELQRMHGEQMHQNTYSVGYECGRKAIADYLLSKINEVIE